MAKQGKRMTLAEKVAQSEAAGNQPVVEDTEVEEETPDPTLVAETLAETLAANAKLLTSLDEARVEAHDLGVKRDDQHQVIQGLRDEVDELERQAKARPFPTAPSGDKGEFTLRGQTVSCKAGIGVVTQDNVKESWVVVCIGGLLYKHGYHQIGLDIDEVNAALGIG